MKMNFSRKITSVHYVERALYLRDQDLGPGPSSAFDVLCGLR